MLPCLFLYLDQLPTVVGFFKYEFVTLMFVVLLNVLEFVPHVFHLISFLLA